MAEVADDTAEVPGGSGSPGERLPVFRGVTQLVLDAKGRLAIPARHRDALAGDGNGRLVLTADPSRCLLLYPLAAWEPIQARLMALSSFDEKIRGLQRLIVGHADDVEIDAAGRILVPPALRRYANLDKHVVLVGQGPEVRAVGRGAMAERDGAGHHVPGRRAASGTVRLHALDAR